VKPTSFAKSKANPELTKSRVGTSIPMVCDIKSPIKN
jgi:hypothetical protein